MLQALTENQSALFTHYYWGQGIPCIQSCNAFFLSIYFFFVLAVLQQIFCLRITMDFNHFSWERVLTA